MMALMVNFQRLRVKIRLVRNVPNFTLLYHCLLYDCFDGCTREVSEHVYTDMYVCVCFGTVFILVTGVPRLSSRPISECE